MSVMADGIGGQQFSDIPSIIWEVIHFGIILGYGDEALSMSNMCGPGESWYARYARCYRHSKASKDGAA